MTLKGGQVTAIEVINAAPVGTDPTAAGKVPLWVKVATVTFTTFSVAALTTNVNLFTLVAAGIIHAVKIKHSTNFTGGAIASYTISVGISGTVAKYASAFDVFQAVSATAFQLSSTVGSENHTATAQITATATSTVGNLNAATQGSADIWCLLSKAV